MDYRKTLNLPKTDFPMKADLAQKEARILTEWDQTRLYERLLADRLGKPPYILHDGPPYANGHIHIGTALNKILKDFVVKSKAMEGMRAPFVPGWDCHGLPIEHQVLKELGTRRHQMSILEIRQHCREYAQKFIKIQRDEFKRLGGLGDWENPYLTMTPDYEANIVREFGKVVQAGGVYRAKKPVLWCPNDETALAEAEVEYEEHTSPSIYVKFRVLHDPLERLDPVKFKNLSFVIWTTTPWTLIANKAVCLHPEFDYQALRVSEETWIIAKQLVEKCMKEFGINDYSVVRTFRGADLEHLVCRSPFVEYPTGEDWTSKVILGKHVTLEHGTGCVHTAPGHGQEDYEVGLEYDLPIFAPLDARGRFTDEVNDRVSNLKGIEVHKANDWIIKRLKEMGTLIKHGTLTHSYPHCWRCKKPVIFRATEQWFISMEKNQLRERALKEIDRTTWIPSWGRDRIYGMVESRPDWCISRQRVWGVPIVAFQCEGCKTILYSSDAINHVANQIESAGADIWFTRTAQELLPPGTVCPNCKGSRFTKENDILDVWFESGVSHAAVLKKRPELSWPADLYLEGSDQHRGWFHSTLLAALETDGRAPYKAVLTHGFVVDGSGKKMSKSAGNVVAPQEVIQKYGAEILRLWVAATDFREDIRISQEILSHLIEAYRKIRNTGRFLLGNLYDYDPKRDAVSDDRLEEIDRWALMRLQVLIQKVRQAYNEFEFHTVFHALNNFCAVDLSAVYLDILKDRLYSDPAGSLSRRAAQRVLFETLGVLTRLMAPILSFTADEIWNHIPRSQRDQDSVHLCSFPKVREDLIDKPLADRWEKLLAIRGAVTKALEEKRNEKVIGASQEAQVRLIAEGELYDFLKTQESQLASVFIVSKVILERGAFDVIVTRSDDPQCARCWQYRKTVGRSPDHPTLCDRCVDAVSEGQSLP